VTTELAPAPQPVDDEIVLEAGRADAHYLRDLWRYRELMGFLAWRDIKVRYSQAVLGIGWAVVQPAVQTVLLTFVFGKLARMADGGIPYPLIVLAGLLPWQLFTSAFNGTGNSLSGNSNLISKVYFPRLLVPLSGLAVALVDFAIMLALALPVIAIFGVLPTWRILFLPLFVLLTLLIAFGAGLWTCALTVKYRDFRFITPFLLQIGVFVTPVGFRADLLPNWRDLIALNPVSGVIDGVRWCLLGGEMKLYFPGLGISIVVATILVATGVWFFRKTERQFADVI